MINREIYDEVSRKFREHFGRPHATAAYAPGRIEVLGNHTDYNEGFVLSAAINLGTFFLSAPSNDSTCRLVAGDLMEEVIFDAVSPVPCTDKPWSNYVKGVFAGLRQRNQIEKGFEGMFLGNIPLGAGLSSSAALEMAAGLVFCSLYDIQIDKLDLAKIGQMAEHEYAGVRCGLLDQISSLCGEENGLVMSDFRTLQVQNLPLGDSVRFLMCNTNVKHSLVDGKYNELRLQCEEAVTFFSSVLDHRVSALRDINREEWEQHSSAMDPTVARRAAHIIGENERVLKGKDLIANSNLHEFGKLMFDSHRSSVENFENSCPELDFLVSQAQVIPGVMGARLSGGGFGGSVVVLLHPRDVEVVSKALASSYEKEFGHSCDSRVITPSDGAKILIHRIPRSSSAVKAAP